MIKKNVLIIGAGFSGITAAAYLAKCGYKVTVLEKNDELGGRARKFTTHNGFTFDMGPSWYWMPDIIESFFNDFDTTTSNFFDLVPLNPQFEIIFNKEVLALPGNFSQWLSVFENKEKGSGKQLTIFMTQARYKYEVGMKDFVTKPCHSWSEFFSPVIAKSAFKLDLLSNFRTYTKRYFKNEQLRTVMEFPVIFLGASPNKIPALYSLMNYGGYKLGTWYPMGGFSRLVDSMVSIAVQQGVTFLTNQEVVNFHYSEDEIKTVETKNNTFEVDAVIGSADYNHLETLLPEKYRNYNAKYWSERTFAPSCLIYYIGLNERIPNIVHHSLFFEHELDTHIHSIYESKTWPTKPLFYVCCPSQTDKSVAPEGCENLFLLMPIANNLDDDEETRNHYLQEMISRIEQKTGTKDLFSKIIFKRSYCVSNFKEDYFAYGGNAYGLANTLKQTAVLKPAIKNKKIKNLWYTGQLTVPGPGVPPAIISGKIVANELIKNYSR